MIVAPDVRGFAAFLEWPLTMRVTARAPSPAMHSDDGLRGAVSEEERTAYHEAGHALIAFVLRRRVCRLTIVPEGGATGTCLYGAFRGDVIADAARNRWTRFRLEREICLSLAGPVAESIRAHGRTHAAGARGDMVAAQNLAAVLARSESEMHAHVKWLWTRTRNVLHTPELWTLVCRVSDALLNAKTIRERELRTMLSDAPRVWRPLRATRDVHATAIL